MAEDELKNNKNEGWNKENNNNNVLEFDSNGLELDKKNEDGSSLYSSDEELDVSDIAKGILNEYSNTQKEENKENVEVEQSSEISDNGNQEEVTKQENSEISRDVSSSNVSLSESEISDTSDDDISEDSQNSSKSKFSIKKKNTKEQINTRITKCVEEINETLKNDPLKPEDVEKINGLNKEIHDLVKNNLNIKDFLKSDNFTNIKNDDIKKVLRRSLIWSSPNIADRLVVRPVKGAWDVVRHPMHHKKIVLSVTSPVWVPLGIAAAGVAVGVGVPVAAVGIPSYGIYKGAKMGVEKINNVRKRKSIDKIRRKGIKDFIENGAKIIQEEGKITKEKHSNTKIMERYQKLTFKEILKKREKRIDKLSKFVNDINVLRKNIDTVELSRAKRKVNIINTELLSKMASRNDVNDYKDLNLEQLIRMKNIAKAEKDKENISNEIRRGLDDNEGIFMEAVVEKIKEGKTKGINAESFKKFMEGLSESEVGYLMDKLKGVNYKELNKKSLKMVMGMLAKGREEHKIIMEKLKRGDLTGIGESIIEEVGKKYTDRDKGELKNIAIKILDEYMENLQNKMDEIYHYATRTKGYKSNVVTKYIPEGVSKPSLHEGKDYSLLARALFNVEDRNMKTRDAMLDYLNQNIIKPNKEKDKVVFAELKNDNDKIMNKISVKLDQNKYERYSVKELMEKRVKLTNEIIKNYKEHNKNGFNVKNKLEQLVNIDNVLEKVINNTLNKGVDIESVTKDMSKKALESLKELTGKMQVDGKLKGQIEEQLEKINLDRSMENSISESNQELPSPEQTAPQASAQPSSVDVSPAEQQPVVGNVPQTPQQQQQTNVEVKKSGKESNAEGELGDMIKDLSNKEDRPKQEERINQIIGALGKDAEGAEEINIIINGNDLNVQIKKSGKVIPEKEVKIKESKVECIDRIQRTEIGGFENMYSGQRNINKDVKINEIGREAENRTDTLKRNKSLSSLSGNNKSNNRSKNSLNLGKN